MASGIVLKMTFNTMSGSKTWSFNYADPSLSDSTVKELGAAMIENGSIFTYQPVQLASAKVVTTSERSISL